MRTPDWAEVEAFCRIDGWEEVSVGRSPDHRYYRLVLDDGAVLETRVSHSSKKPLSQGRWRAILRDQLGVSDEDFWKSLRDKKPVRRPSRQPLEEEIEQIPLWAAELLTARQGMSLADIAQLGRARAIEMAREAWANPTT